jgi:hypothetical protein
MSGVLDERELRSARIRVDPWFIRFSGTGTNAALAKNRVPDAPRLDDCRACRRAETAHRRPQG